MLPSEIAFTDTVKKIQERKGSRESYAKMYGAVHTASGFTSTITQELVDFIATQNSVFLSTVNADGQPYIQHRGGPAGFLKVLDEHTIAFADYKGNRQYISQGNLIDNPKAFLFLIDYTTRTRVKIWGEATVIEDDEELVKALMPSRDEYRAFPEQVIKFRVSVWDGNCPQHIPLRLGAEEVKRTIQERDEEIARLKQQIENMA